MRLINFLVYSPQDILFLKSIDPSNIERKYYYFKIIKKVVDEIGTREVVQVVTGNEVVIKCGGEKLMKKFLNLY